ncbi:unnamed protein product [Euphydryas editha]|uniref:Uncharacterized protein n=1 Tax=Euphydryas editha TaxID=104508 RepID=A0AAU9U4G6_EUPED|nr:unnamed protein product [Euphydryas editha]
MTYTSPVFAYCKPIYIQKLQVIQNKFLCMATASPWNIHRVDLHRDFRIDSISKHLEILSTAHLAIARQHPNPLITQTCSYVGRENLQTRQRRPIHILTDPDDRITIANALYTHIQRHTQCLRRPRRRSRRALLRAPFPLFRRHPKPRCDLTRRHP